MAQPASKSQVSDEASASADISVAERVMYPASVELLKRQLRALGADRMDLSFPETSALPYVLHPGEEIIGIVYGRYKQSNGKFVGRGALVATQDRVFLLDKKPTYVKLDEVIYDAISGMTFGRVWWASTVVLHTKMGDISLRTFNRKLALELVEAVEDKIYGRSRWKVRS